MAVSHGWVSSEAIRETVRGSEGLSVAMGCANRPMFTFPKQCLQILAWLREWG